MKIVFISNYLNHHQLSMCLSFDKKEYIDFKFIATTKVPQFRTKLGYTDMNEQYDFIIRTYQNREEQNKALLLCEDADVVIFGSAPEKFIKARLKKGKLTFKYSERICKIKPPFYQMPLRAIKYFWQNGRHKNLYLLCASAYVAADYAKTGTFLGKTYKWGYFSAVKKYDNIDELIQNKEKNSLIWVGRFIDWKHPEMAIEIAKRLKEDGYDFKLNIVGTGPMEYELKELIKKYSLENEVKMLGSKPPEKVREYMERSQIHLFTSDRQEGWGAVLNESMNSGCAVVASHMIGSVPFLVNDKYNGRIYQDGDVEDLYKNVKSLLDTQQKRIDISKQAYSTMINEWNAENATDKFIKLATELLKGNEKPSLFNEGVCSKAEILKDDWYNL